VAYRLAKECITGGSGSSRIGVRVQEKHMPAWLYGSFHTGASVYISMHTTDKQESSM
jgi:hypothetical protein